MPDDANDRRAAFTPSRICAPFRRPGDAAGSGAISPHAGSMRHNHGCPPAAPAAERVLAGSARPRRTSPRARRALPHLAIIGAGTVIGLLLGSQLSPLVVAPMLLATDAGGDQTFAVASRTSVGSSPPVPGLESGTAVPPDGPPNATGAAVLGFTAGAKGRIGRWQPKVALGAGDMSRAVRHATAARSDARALEPAAALARSTTQESARAFYERARSRQRQGDVEAAMAGYARAAALDPGHAAAWYNWGRLLEQSGAVDEALAKYLRAVRADRSHRFAWYNLGYLLQTRGEVERAIRVYERAIAHGATHPLTFYNLGWLQQNRGRHGLAAQLYREALALDPSHVLARYNLGWLLERSGDLEGAAEQYRAVLEIAPDHALARESLARIEARRAQGVAARPG